MFRREMKNFGDIHFIRTMLSNLKPRRTNIEYRKPINLTFCLDYDTLRKEHLFTIDFINRYEKFKGSLVCNLKVLLPESS